LFGERESEGNAMFGGQIRRQFLQLPAESIKVIIGKTYECRPSRHRTKTSMFTCYTFWHPVSVLL
jgi:hypothetical protein